MDSRVNEVLAILRAKGYYDLAELYTDDRIGDTVLYEIVGVRRPTLAGSRLGSGPSKDFTAYGTDRKDSSNLPILGQRGSSLVHGAGQFRYH